MTIRRVAETDDSMTTFRTAVELVRSLRGLRFGRPATDDAVNRAEAALDFGFPPTVHAFVSEFGSCTAGAVAVLGIDGNQFGTGDPTNAVGATLIERMRGLPRDHLVIANPGDGTRLAVDTSAAPFPVVRWDARTGETKPAYPSFAAYLLAFARDVQATADSAAPAPAKPAKPART